MNLQALLSIGALSILGLLAALMMFFPVPSVNHDHVTFILGALSGALTTVGALKLAKPGESSSQSQP